MDESYIANVYKGYCFNEASNHMAVFVDSIY